MPLTLDLAILVLLVLYCRDVDDGLVGEHEAAGGLQAHASRGQSGDNDGK